jgi:hypothetical protein
VPGHPDEERSVVSVIGRPPILRRRQDLLDILLDGIEVEACKRLGVIEIFAQWVGFGGMLPKWREVELVRPPNWFGFGSP